MSKPQTDLILEEKPREACGIIGIFAPNEDVASMAYFGLFALQHRGQEACGIAVSDGQRIRLHKDVGLVPQVFNPQNLAPLKGKYAIGHTRYSTTGSSAIRNAQPFLIDTRHGPLAVAHNGNLVNAAQLRRGLLQRGVGLSSTSDSEIITMMLAGGKGDDWMDRIQDTMPHWQGAYSLILLTKQGVFAVRDPWGFRPLSIGMLPRGGHAVASEFGALATLGCNAIREVRPGEIVALSNSALRVRQAVPPAAELAQCTFEHIYFSRPDGVWDQRSIYQVRQRLGEELAREAPREADVVIPVPDSSIPAAIGYAQRSGIPYIDGFVKNRYIGRTFIQPTDSLRKQGVALKFSVIGDNVRNKRLIVIDDSIVRGNTSGPLVRMLRNAGASQVHLLITCPPIRHPCHMGVDMGTKDELIASHSTVEQIRQHIGCDSLYFLSLEGMMGAIGRREGYCNACFTGIYPVEIDFEHTKTDFEVPSRT
ncbi:MAG: amidophosphoribosyltransferase [Anaerolineales bacterium]|jgi:amidophosphoribosyltransferase